MARLFTCRACGKDYDSIDEMEMTDATGLSEQTQHQALMLCKACATAWDVRQRDQGPDRDPEADFRRFQQERRH